MKKHMRPIVCAALFLAALCVCLVVADRALMRDDSQRKYGAFYEEEQDIDVFFMGSSRMLDGVSPMELWRDWGVTSYNLGNSSECLEMTEWVLRLALQEHTPKVAVIDVYYINRKLDDFWSYSFRHLFLDSVPLSLRKFEAVRATLPRDKWMEFMMPFSLYHGRWEEILGGTTWRMVDSEPFMMGSELRAGRAVIGDYERTQEATVEELPGTKAVYAITQLCRENGVEPVFIALPAADSREDQMDVNSVGPIARELGVPFINMADMEIIDLHTDLYDETGHLNPDGASKVTAWLGQYLTENYALDDRREDGAYAHWNERLAQYEAYWQEKWGGMTLLGR